MSDINQKIPFQQSLNSFAQRKVSKALQMLGQALPARVVGVAGSIVTVAFDVTPPDGVVLPQVTIPIFGGEWIRYPTQVGDKGFVIPADVSLRHVSGLGTGIPDLTDPGNLTALVFMPVGNANWFSVNPNYLVLYGKTGVEITTPNLDCTLTLTSSGIVINLNGGNLTINNGNTTMNGNLTVTGTITNNGKNIGSTHTHSGVQPGSGNTGAPN